jgi:serine O-acetyltransferase
LGSFTVGAGAKIGSNAVVVKPVPAGATAVGNPAHIVGSKPKEADKPATPAFSGYGVNTNEEDPVTQTLKILMERLERAEVEQAKLAAQLQAKNDEPNP